MDSSRYIRLSALLLLLASIAAGAAPAPLFPTPLHVTRVISEPLTAQSATVEQYYFGSRVVTVRGERSVIVDYDKREITEIDRANATYSITKFDDEAAARGPRTAKHSTAAVTRSRSDFRGGRGVEIYTADDADLHAEIAIDASVVLSREAFDVIIGAAYPASGGATADLARGAATRDGGVHAASGGAASDSYGLPIEQTFRWNAGGESLTSSNRVTRVGDETAPAELIAIPPGARLVESRRIETKRLADQLDSIPPRKH
jgi:hypothetical protein